MNKNLLMLPTAFPPQGAIGSIRTGTFAKYLPKHGWNPVVICRECLPENGDYDPGYIQNLNCPNVFPVKTIARNSKRARLQRRITNRLKFDYYFYGCSQYTILNKQSEP